MEGVFYINTTMVFFSFKVQTKASFEDTCNLLSCGCMKTWFARVTGHGCGAYHIMHVLKHWSKCLTYMRRVHFTWSGRLVVRYVWL